MKAPLQALAALALAATLAPGAAADAVVSGNFQYVDRAFTFDGWTGVWPKLPVRRAEVLVLDATTGEVLASGHTDDQGDFALQVLGSGPRDLVARCLTRSTLLGPSEARVTDNAGLQVYSVSSPTFAAWDLGQPLDTGQSTAQSVVQGKQYGSPFNAFDQIVLAFDYVTSLGAPPLSAPYAMHWPSNTTKGGSNESWIQFHKSYSDPVVLHELGHGVDYRWGEPDNPGGTHSFGQSDQNPSLALGEGFATYFQAAARLWSGQHDPGFYFSGSGSAGSGPGTVLLRADLETRFPFTAITGGEADEVAVAATQWDLNDGVGTPDGDGVDDDAVDGSFLFAGGLTGEHLVWQAQTSPTVKAASGVHVIDTFDAMFVDLGVLRYDELRDTFALSGIRTDADAFEPDDLYQEAQPILSDGAWSPVHTLWSPGASPPVPGRGDMDSYVAQLAPNRKYRVETRYPNGLVDARTYADTAIFLSPPWGGLGATDDDSGVGRNARVDFTSGDGGPWVMTVFAWKKDRPTGTYQVRLLDLGPVPPPALVTVEPKVVTTVEPGIMPHPQLLGSGFLGVDSVTVGGVPAVFWIYGDDKIVLTLPQTGKLGTHEIVVSSPGGTAKGTIEVVPPAVPTLSSGYSYWQWDEASMWFGAQPGDGLLLLVSASDQPTSLPGLVELDLGAGGTDLLLLATATTSGSGWIELVFPLPDHQGPPVDLWLQGIVLPASGATLPLGTTNLVASKLY